MSYQVLFVFYQYRITVKNYGIVMTLAGHNSKDIYQEGGKRLG